MAITQSQRYGLEPITGTGYYNQTGSAQVGLTDAEIQQLEQRIQELNDEIQKRATIISRLERDYALCRDHTNRWCRRNSESKLTKNTIYEHLQIHSKAISTYKEEKATILDELEADAQRKMERAKVKAQEAKTSEQQAEAAQEYQKAEQQKAMAQAERGKATFFRFAPYLAFGALGLIGFYLIFKR